MSATPDPERHFLERVWPVLTQNCFRCHGGREKIRGDLRLTTREGVLEGGRAGCPTCQIPLHYARPE